ncbi:hypothetical protein ACW7G2_09550 [Luteimonas sp. A277]
MIVIVLLCGNAFARELREYSLTEKVEASDMIVVGRVVGVERPGIEGVRAFARVEVSDGIKGATAGDELRFVIRGSIAEADPDCCKVGCEYLFFAVRGIQVLLVEGTEIGGKMSRQDQFVSATNGRFSTYRLGFEGVKDWPRDGEGPTPLAEVRSDIESLLDR